MRQQVINLSKVILPHAVRVWLRRLNWKRYYFFQSIGRQDGPSVHCPIVDRDFKRFIRLRGDLISPTNGAKSRQRLVWLYLKNELNLLQRKADVLHVAPELCFMDVLRVTPGLSYTAGDKMVEGYGPQSGIVELDITAMSFPEASFDVIICNHVLEHVPDDASAIRELFRVLRPSGVAVVTVPIKDDLKHTHEDPTIISPADRRREFGQWDHVRWYGVDIRDRFMAAGFSVQMNKFGRTFPTDEYARLGLCDDTIVVATKPPL